MYPPQEQGCEKPEEGEEQEVVVENVVGVDLLRVGVGSAREELWWSVCGFGVRACARRCGIGRRRAVVGGLRRRAI